MWLEALTNVETGHLRNTQLSYQIWNLTTGKYESNTLFETKLLAKLELLIDLRGIKLESGH